MALPAFLADEEIVPAKKKRRDYLYNPSVLSFRLYRKAPLRLLFCEDELPIKREPLLDNGLWFYWVDNYY